jgi:hypothetical protein
MSDLSKKLNGEELYQLTTEQANAVLRAFLYEEQTVLNSLHLSSLKLDFSKNSLIILFEHCFKELNRMGVTESSYDGLWNLRIAYYFGECLHKISNKLCWAIGNPNFAFANHPVISGFPKKQEAALITITGNLVSAVLFDGQNFSRILDAVNYWFELAEKMNMKNSENPK